MEQEHQSLQARVHSLESELLSARNDSAQFLEDIQAVKQQGSAVRQQLADRVAQCTEWEGRAMAAEMRAREEEKERIRLEAVAKAATERVKILEERLEMMEVMSSSSSSSSSNQTTSTSPATTMTGTAGSDEHPSPSSTDVSAQLQSLREQVDSLSQQLADSRAINQEHAATIASLTASLAAKEQELVDVRTTNAALRTKESDASRLLTQQARFETEIGSLHSRLQKQEVRHAEEKEKGEGKLRTAELSLEAYKKEIEDHLKAKFELEKRASEMEIILAAAKKEAASVTEELKLANSKIKEYEGTIAKLQAIDASKDMTLLLRAEEVTQLKATIARNDSDANMTANQLREESIRLQSQVESLSQENLRLRVAIEDRRNEEAISAELLREGEAKIDHWREGLENSYQQKRILKEAMRKVLEESDTVKGLLKKEKVSRKALERAMMMREDMDSQKRKATQEESNEEEFGSPDWARRVGKEE